MPLEDQPILAESRHYPEVVALQAHQPESAPEATGKLLASPEGYLELEHEARELQQALALDFDIAIPKQNVSNMLR